MTISTAAALTEQPSVDAVALPVSQPAKRGITSMLDHESAEVGREYRELLNLVVGTGELRGELGEALVLYRSGTVAPPRLVAAGIGPRERVDADALRTCAAATARSLSRVGGTLAWLLDESLSLSLSEQAAALIEGTLLGSYYPGRWKRRDAEDPRPFDRIVIVPGAGAGTRDAATRAALIAERTNRARDLTNMPPNELTPAVLAERARAIASEHEHLSIRVLVPDELSELGMEALLSVSRGSDEEPRLIVVRYEPPNAVRRDVVLGLVGKSMTFDSGGLSLKPVAHMEDMKADMAGGAAALEGIGALAALGTPIRAIAVLAAAENLPGAHAFRPGDILRAANGQTIEVVNTDAEGRLVLADALWYARREGATHLLDFATLTGVMKLALGDLYAGVFGEDGGWRDLVVKAGARSGDRVWPFPLHQRYRRYVDSDFADIKNHSWLEEGVPALAAEFLHEFAGDGPWAHVDMFGPSFLRRPRGDFLNVAGGTGFGVRLIVELGRMLVDEHRNDD
jgi:leucyl aminopeptidase